MVVIHANHPHSAHSLTVLEAVKGSLAALGAVAPLTASARRNSTGRYEGGWLSLCPHQTHVACRASPRRTP